MDIGFTVTFEGPERTDVSARWGTVRLGGVPVFTELVYDTDPATNERTEEQATVNLVRVFGRRLERLMEGDDR